MCIKSFIERHKSIVLSLERIQDDTTFDGKQRSEAAGLLLSINTKQFLATLYLFHEVFGHTGPLSRYLQSTHADFSNAMTMVNAVVTSLEQMRENAGEIIRIMEQAVGDFDNVAWKPTRIRYCRTTTAHSSNAVQDTETPLEAWERNTFYVVIDTILGSLRNRFEKNKLLFDTLSILSPLNFLKLQASFKTIQDLECHLKPFCDKYDLDAFRCAEELLSFAQVFDKFKSFYEESEQGEQSVSISDDDECKDKEETEQTATDDICGEIDGMNTISMALSILCNPQYHLLDAFSELCKLYSIAVAIPVSSCTAERSFSALKRVKTRLRSTMVQERLEGLMLMAVEKKLLMSISYEAIVQQLAQSSSELSRALL